MVEVTEITDSNETHSSSPPQSPSPSGQRTLDADEIESICNQYATRPSVKVHLTSLVQKIRRDALALKKIEDSRLKFEKEERSTRDANQKKEEEEEQEVLKVEEVEADTQKKSTTTAATAPTPSPASLLTKFIPIDKFSFDAGSYSSPTISIYITSFPSNMNLSTIPKSSITCQFTTTSFDLQILNIPPNNHNFRLYKDNLSHDIDPSKSKYILKPNSNKIIIKLGKIKNDYGGYDTWNELIDKKGKESKNKLKKDPSAGIMDLMKEMYDSGDDQMKKMIGETMLKQREGKLDSGLGKGGGGLGGDDF